MATRRQAQRAIEIHQDELIQYPNVTGLGVVPVEDGPGESAVAVYVTAKAPEDELRADEQIPPTLQVPGREDPHEVPTQVIARGEFAIEEEQFGIEPI
jgi:hypothetical protein